MKKGTALAYLGAALLGICAGSVSAYDREAGEWDAGLFGGVYFPDPSALDDGTVGGGQIGYRADDHIAFTTALSFASIDGSIGASQPHIKYNIDAALLDLNLWYIFFPKSRFSLHLGVGPGWAWVDGSTNNDPNNNSQSGHATDDSITGNVALGPVFKFDNFNVSLMGRARYFDHRDNDDVDQEVTLGISIPLGHRKVEAPPVVAPAPAPAPKPAPVVVAKCSDGDNDGVCDTADQCPNTPAGARVGTAGCDCDYTLRLQFAFNSAELTAADKTELDALSVLLSNPKLGFIEGTVNGYTDSVGADAYNQGLSERRANSVTAYLMSKGAAQKFIAKGFGEADPVASNDTDEGRAQNRRVVVRRTDCEK